MGAGGGWSGRWESNFLIGLSSFGLCYTLSFSIYDPQTNISGIFYVLPVRVLFPTILPLLVDEGDNGVAHIKSQHSLVGGRRSETQDRLWLFSKSEAAWDT